MEDPTVDKFFSRLEDILLDLMRGLREPNRGQDSHFGARPHSRSYFDRDYDDAWEELDEFLKTGSDSGEARQSRRRPRAESEPRDSLRSDYQTLNVPFAAPFADVRKSYRSLIRKHHPDRFAGDERKLKEATSRTARINAAFNNIERFEEGRSS